MPEEKGNNSQETIKDPVTQGETKNENKQEEPKQEEPKQEEPKPEANKKAELTNEEIMNELNRLKLFESKVNYEKKIDKILKEENFEAYGDFFKGLPLLSDDQIKESINNLKEHMKNQSSIPFKGEKIEEPVTLEEKMMREFSKFNF